jgi:uncharacterized protein YifE (UPF0438 family)
MSPDTDKDRHWYTDKDKKKRDPQHSDTSFFTDRRKTWVRDSQNEFTALCAKVKEDAELKATSRYPFGMFYKMSSEQVAKSLTKTFRDPHNFSGGFGRSGEFTLEQTALLRDNGMRLLALQMGCIVAETPDDHSFIAFISGHNSASTNVELVWAKYMTYV